MEGIRPPFLDTLASPEGPVLASAALPWEHVAQPEEPGLQSPGGGSHQSGPTARTPAEKGPRLLRALGRRRSSGLRVPARTARPFCDTRAQAGSFFSPGFGAHAPYLNLARPWEMCRKANRLPASCRFFPKPFYIHQNGATHISKGPYSPGVTPSCRHPSAHPSVWLEQFPEQKVLCSIRDS